MLRVLLVEDSRADELLIAAKLREGGLRYELQRVESRAAFAAALENWQPDVVLSDYKVPGFGGEEALALSQASPRQVPFLFVSGALGEHAAVELLKRGATDYVLKQQLERLVPSVERALREAREKAERREAERRLEERERTLSALLRNLPGMAFRSRVVTPPWYLEFASEGCFALTGYPPEAFTREGGVDFASLVHPDDLARIGDEAAAVFTSGGQLTTTYRLRTAGGEERWVWARAVSHIGEDGAPMLEGFVTDITAQKVAEAEVLRRIEFEKQLIGIVSHDLKNPLHAIQLGATLLLKREDVDAAATKLTRRILNSTERATRMINDLLDFTQVRLGAELPVTPREVDLRDLAAQVLDEFEASHPDRRLVFESPPAVPAFVDPGRVSQALTNLVQNALSYSPKETPVSVRLAVDGDHARFEVHNRGEPIAPEQLPVVFEPLRRGAAAGSGHARSIGLGLFIVQSIARAHDGEVSVRSTAEEGTSFVVRLPLIFRRNPAP